MSDSSLYDAFSRHMRAAIEEPEEEGTVSWPLKEAQAMELRLRFDAFRTQHDLKPGDLVREKHGIGFLKDNLSENAVLMLWRFLDENDAQDWEKIQHFHRTLSFERVDCIVIFVDDDGDTRWIMHNTAALEPRTDCELPAA